MGDEISEDSLHWGLESESRVSTKKLYIFKFSYEFKENIMW